MTNKTISTETVDELIELCDAYIHLQVIIGTGDAENVQKILTVLNRQFEQTMKKLYNTE